MVAKMQVLLDGKDLIFNGIQFQIEQLRTYRSVTKVSEPWQVLSGSMEATV